MSIEEIIAAQLDKTVERVDFAGLGELYRGKVRDVYKTPRRLVIVTTDRVSAFDHVLGTIPFKGEILNRIAADGFERTRDILPNHVIAVPDPNVLVARPVRAYPVELVVRAFITGSLWRDYEAGRARAAYGIDFEPDLARDQRLSGGPILTPSTKAEHGRHDEPISRSAIVERGLMTKGELDRAEEAVLALFVRGAALAEARGLILVDTKYELGVDEDGTLTVIDEIHTPDSSRYWIASEYVRRFEAGQPQAMLDKENLRQWLIDTHGFMGHGEPPPLDDAIRTRLSLLYMRLYERLLGRPFEPTPGDVRARIGESLRTAGLLPGS